MAQDAFYSLTVSSDTGTSVGASTNDSADDNYERHPSAMPCPYSKSIHRRDSSPSPPLLPLSTAASVSRTTTTAVPAISMSTSASASSSAMSAASNAAASSKLPTSSTTDSGFPTAEPDQDSDGGRSSTPVSLGPVASVASSIVNSACTAHSATNSSKFPTPLIRETDLLNDSNTACANRYEIDSHDDENQQQQQQLDDYECRRLSAKCAVLEREAEYYKQQQGTTMEVLDKSDRLNDRLKAEIAFLRNHQQQQQHERQHSVAGSSSGSIGCSDSNYHVYTGTRAPASLAYPMHHQLHHQQHQHLLHQAQPTPPPASTSSAASSTGVFVAMPAGAAVVSSASQSSGACQSCEALQSMCAALHRKQAEASSALRASEQDRAGLRLQLDQLAAEARSLADDRLALLRQVSDLRVALYREQENSQAVSIEWRKVMSERADVHEEIRQLTNRGDLAEDRLRAVEAQRDEALEACRQRRCGSGGEAAAELVRLRDEAADLRQLQATAQSQRDWALQQRAAALEEREALRNLCEQLRSERDQAVSRHADIMRRCDQLETEKRHLARQLQEALSSAAAPAATASSSAAGDSLTPLDCLVDVDIGPIGKSMGFQVTGGPHQPLAVNDASLYVLNVIPGSQADGRLRVNDQICRVNGANMTGRSAEEVYAALQASGSSSGSCILTVRRRRIHWRTHPVSVRLNGARPADLFQLDAGFYVKRVLQRQPGSRPVEFDEDDNNDGGGGGIAIGDRLLAIDGRQLDGLSLAEARQVLADCRSGTDDRPCQLLVCPYRAYATEDGRTDAGIATAGGSAQSPDSALSSMTKSPTGHWSTETGESEPSGCGSGGAGSGTGSGNGHGKNSVLERLLGRFRSGGGGGSGGKANKKSNAPGDRINEREDAVAAIDELDSMLRGYDRRRGGGGSGGAGGGGFGGVGGSNSKKYATVHGDHFVDSSGGGCVPAFSSGLNTDREIGVKRKERPPLPLVFPTASGCGSGGHRLSSPVSPPPLPGFDQLRHQQQQQHRYSNTNYHSQQHQQQQQPRLGVLAVSTGAGNLSPESAEPVARSDEATVRSHYERRPKSSGTASRLAKADKRLSAAPVLMAERSGSGGGSSGGSVGSGGGCYAGSVARPDVLPWLGGGGSNERIRIPSSASVSKNGSGSRLSSVSSSSADSGKSGVATYLTSSANNSAMTTTATTTVTLAGVSSGRRPRPGSVRQVRMDKGSEPLGIRIHAGQQGGIYISSVQPGSLADRAGLLAGDRILEFCGVNLRTAFYHNARQVLNDCREEVATLLVQYCCSAPDNDTTPTNSPSARHQLRQHQQPQQQQQQPQQQQIHQNQQQHQHQPSDPEEPRWVFLQPSVSGGGRPLSLGFSFVGGSETGILVSEVEPGIAGLMPGDLILQCNGIDFRGLTAESANQELARAAAAATDEARLLVQHRPSRLDAVVAAIAASAAGIGEHDALFVRPNFAQMSGSDAVAAVSTSDDSTMPEPLLTFRQHDVLLVTDTRPAGRPSGWWFAWLLDGAGQRIRSGLVPSPRRLLATQQQQQLALMQTNLGSRSVSLRRSSGKRSSSAASSASNSSSADYLHPHLRLPLPAYSRTDLVSDPGAAGPRPVAILGPLAEALSRALCAERADLFYQLGPLPLDRVAGACAADSARHGLLQLASGPAQVDQLQRLHRVYPIVLLLRYRNHKLVKEARDPRYCPEKINGHAAKELLKRAAALEEELQPVLTACIQGGVFSFMASQIVSVVARDQNSPIWITGDPIVP